jgi:uncharacterized protein
MKYKQQILFRALKNNINIFLPVWLRSFLFLWLQLFERSKKQKLFVVAALLLTTYLVQGQGSVHRIEVLTNNKKDSIQIRWAPTSTIVWQLGNKYGYVLQRYTIARNGVLVTNPKSEIKTLATAPLKPMSESDMDVQANTNDYVAMVKGCIYNEENKDPNNKAGGFGTLLMGKDELEMRFGFALLAADLSINAAKAHGLYFVDTDVKANEKYAYQVSIAQQPKGLVVAPAIGIGAINELTKLNPPRDLGINIKNEVATLRWLITLDRRQYSAYIIERSYDGNNFVRINEKPYVTAATDKNKEYAFYKDSMPSDNVNYQYRIKGITPFAEEGPYSATVGGKINPDVSLPVIDSLGLTVNNKLYLHWVLENDLKKIAKEIYVTRSNKVTGPFTQLHTKPFTKNTESFIDEKPNQNNYYRIKVVTTQNKTVYSIPNLGQVADTIAPAAPIGVQGVIDSNGIVTLRWNKNGEKDLLGYRVAKSNTADQDYIEVANRIIKKTSFTDTININTLSKKIFYKITAVDKNFNPSEYSIPVELNRPDKIAPVAAVFTKALIVDSAMHIQLQWLPSSSTDDMVKQILVRKKLRLQEQTNNNATQATVLETATLAVDTTGRLNSYTDAKAEQGHTYIYYLQTYDASNNSSEARTGELFFETGFREAIKDLTITSQKQTNTIVLNWKEATGNVAYFLLYKSINGGPFYSWQKTKENKITDADVKAGLSIAYKIIAVFTNDTRSKMSQAFKIVY